MPHRFNLVMCALPTGTPSLSAFAAGYLEGYVSSQLMCDFSYDLQAATFGDNVTQQDGAARFLRTNYRWAADNVASNSSVYWAQVCGGRAWAAWCYDWWFVCAPLFCV